MSIANAEGVGNDDQSPFDHAVKDGGAVLPNWGSACFPDGVEALHKAYTQFGSDLPLLDTVASLVDGFTLTGHEDNPTTSNGLSTYEWQVAYYYEFPIRGEAAVLFPKSGTVGMLRLHTAIFVRGAGDDVAAMLRRLIKNLTTAIEGCAEGS